MMAKPVRATKFQCESLKEIPDDLGGKRISYNCMQERDHQGMHYSETLDAFWERPNVSWSVGP